MNSQKISDLTTEELQYLIRKTVRESMIKIITEYTIAAEVNAQLEEEASFNALMRASMNKLDLSHYISTETPQRDD